MLANDPDGSEPLKCTSKLQESLQRAAETDDAAQVPALFVQELGASLEAARAEREELRKELSLMQQQILDLQKHAKAGSREVQQRMDTVWEKEEELNRSLDVTFSGHRDEVQDIQSSLQTCRSRLMRAEGSIGTHAARLRALEEGSLDRPAADSELVSTMKREFVDSQEELRNYISASMQDLDKSFQGELARLRSEHRHLIEVNSMEIQELKGSISVLRVQSERHGTVLHDVQEQIYSSNSTPSLGVQRFSISSPREPPQILDVQRKHGVTTGHEHVPKKDSAPVTTENNGSHQRWFGFMDHIFTSDTSTVTPTPSQANLFASVASGRPQRRAVHPELDGP
mmetsp:Transcript_51012/g.121183  ORF Transcript_51012/g.121183 Transcript_51012/m.121183 type:complete len:341 (-) Transcript_51012:94-1116(-)